MQIKTAVRYYLTRIRMGINKKSTNNKCWSGCGEKGTFLYCCWKCKLIQLLWKTVWRFLKKFKIKLWYDPAVPLLGIYPKEAKSLSWKDICTPMFIAVLLTIDKIQKKTKCPSVDEWVRKMWYIYAVKFYLPLKKKTEVLPFSVTWIDLERLILSEISQSKTYHMISYLCGI